MLHLSRCCIPRTNTNTPSWIHFVYKPHTQTSQVAMHFTRLVQYRALNHAPRALSLSHFNNLFLSPPISTLSLSLCCTDSESKPRAKAHFILIRCRDRSVPRVFLRRRRRRFFSRSQLFVANFVSAKFGAALDWRSCFFCRCCVGYCCAWRASCQTARSRLTLCAVCLHLFDGLVGRQCWQWTKSVEHRFFWQMMINWRWWEKLSGLPQV